MTKEQIKDEIYDYLINCCSNDLLEICNTYHEYTGEGEEIHDITDFDSEMDSYSPTEIANMACNGNWSDSYGYFKCDGYEINCFDDPSDEYDLTDIADYCVDNDEDFGDSGIRDLLNKISDNDFTITLRYSEDSFDTFTLDTLKESSEVDRRDYYLCKDDNRILTLTEWIDELGKLTKDDGVEEVNLIKLDFKQLASEKGLTHLFMVVGYDGYVFGDGYVDGRPFKWFYNVEHDILLKLVYDSDKTFNEYRYIVEVRDKSVEDVFRLVMEN